MPPMNTLNKHWTPSTYNKHFVFNGDVRPGWLVTHFKKNTMPTSDHSQLITATSYLNKRRTASVKLKAN